MARLRRKNVWLLLLADSFVISFGAYGAYLLRFDFQIPKSNFSSLYTLLVVLIFTKLSINVFSNIYSGLWRYTSVSDLISIVKSSTMGTIISAGVALLILGVGIIPRSIFLIDYFLSTGFSPNEDSLIDNIKKIPAGYSISYDIEKNTYKN